MCAYDYMVTFINIPIDVFLFYHEIFTIKKYRYQLFILIFDFRTLLFDFCY